MGLADVLDLGANADVSYSTTATITLLRINSNERTRAYSAVFYLFSTQAGVMDTYYVDQFGNERLLNSINVLANDLAVLDVQFRLTRSVLKFTPAAAPGRVTAESHTY